MLKHYMSMFYMTQLFNTPTIPVSDPFKIMKSGVLDLGVSDHAIDILFS